MSTAFLLLLFVLLGVSNGVDQRGSPPISVILKAHWGRTPVLLEASEYIAEVDEKLFWQFVYQLNNVYQSVSTDKECYDKIITVSQSLLTPPTNHLLLFALAVHAHSPSVQMFQQVSYEVYLSNGDQSCNKTFVNINDEVICNAAELAVILNKQIDSISNKMESFDHCYSANDTLPTVVLYGEIGTVEFSEFFKVLWPKMESGLIRGCVRHWLGTKEREDLILTGYGIQLAIKNTEYKAVDDTKIKEEGNDTVFSQEINLPEVVDGFNFSILKERYDKHKDDLDEFRKYLLDKKKELPQLKAWEISDLGIQATQLIMESEYPLKVLTEISQNLPIQAKSLSRTVVQKEINKEITYNQAILEQYGVSPGDSILLLNGLVLQDDDMDTFNFLERLKKESKLLTGLEDLKISSSDNVEILSTAVHPQHSSLAVDMRNESVIFVNDIEKDGLYSRWPSSVGEFLRPTFPGTLRQIRKNAFNIVFVVDPLTTLGVEFLQYMILFLDHMTPFRMGVLFVSSGCGQQGKIDPIGENLIAVFNYLCNERGPLISLRWLSMLLEDNDNIDWTIISKSLSDRFSISDTDSIVSSDSKYVKNVQLSCEFYLSRGFTRLPQVLVNGVQLNIEEDDLQVAIVSQVQQQTSEIQQLVFRRQITDRTDIYEYFMTKSNVLQRLSYHVSNLNSKKIDLSGSYKEMNLNILTNRQLSAIVSHYMTYLFNVEGEFTTKLITMWVVSDLATPKGRRIASDALKFTLSNEFVRVGFLHNPSPGSTPLLFNMLTAVIKSQRTKVAIETATLLLNSESNEEVVLMNIIKTIEKFNMEKFEAKFNELASSESTVYIAEFLKLVLEMNSGQIAIVSNGRLIGPMEESDSFGIDDFQVLYKFETSTCASNVADIVKNIEFTFDDPDDDTAEFSSDITMKLSSLLRSEQKSKRLKLLGFKQEHSVLSVLTHSETNGPLMQCLLIIDPLSSTAQRLTPLLASLSDILPMNITVIFNPHTKLSEMPLKSFYRSVINSRLSFNESGHLIEPHSAAVFQSLPQSPLFTLNMDVPHSWMVQSVYSLYDLDNIHLAAVEREIKAIFELEYILVEGQCFDAHVDTPIPGLQYVMGTDREYNIYDTIVMANLGYFQLKGRPGAWKLKLREGKSSEIYQISSYHQVGGSHGNNVSSIPVLVNKFTSTVLIVRVEKRPGNEKRSLLKEETSTTPAASEDDTNGGFFDSITKFFTTSGNDSSENVSKQSLPKNETINIFSIASGHLYERFLRIMMLSVLKHTGNPVKFWFLKNYLSPQFKDFIPVMAEKYKFEYELVQYNWPRWLHGQTEKQRLIWGYKILFLDVLFPLDVKKIIFVDADQVVRTDMKELLEVPLDGAPYGYTPFCDSRTDMEGFRFWKRGYWKNHLGKRKYHISALYVIDLQQFRLLAAGDRLRGQYQMLSQDPNSLSNLDQDLPNNMIHNVPIKSLPQDWLWCATWCSEETKSQAKTIDLCNNPQTKEPKLTSALRIVPEWKDYDNEIKLLQQQSSTVNVPTDKHHSHHEL